VPGRQQIRTPVCTGAAEDDAEGVADGVGEDPETRFAFTWDTGGTPCEQFPLGLVGIAHANVQVHLLGMRRVRPAWWNPVSNALESQLAHVRPGTDDHPALISSLMLIPSTWQ